MAIHSPIPEMIMFTKVDAKDVFKAMVFAVAAFGMLLSGIVMTVGLLIKVATTFTPKPPAAPLVVPAPVHVCPSPRPFITNCPVCRSNHWAYPLGTGSLPTGELPDAASKKQAR